MKSLIALVTCLAASMAMAAAQCPPGSSTVVNCHSTPEASDAIVAAEVFDSIAVCARRGQTKLVFEKNGESDVSVAQVVSRAGGTTYSVQANDIEFRLSVVAGTSSPVTRARFSLVLTSAGVASTSTYTCSR